MMRDNDQVDVIVHDAEVFYREAVSALGSRDGLKKELLDSLGKENEFAAVRAGDDMIPRGLDNTPWLSHTTIHQGFTPPASANLRPLLVRPRLAHTPPLHE